MSKAVIRAFPSWQEGLKTRNQAADQISSIKHLYTTSTGPSVQMLRTVLPSLSNRSGLLPVVPISIHPPSLLLFCSR